MPIVRKLEEAKELEEIGKSEEVGELGGIREPKGGRKNRRASVTDTPFMKSFL